MATFCILHIRRKFQTRLRIVCLKPAWRLLSRSRKNSPLLLLINTTSPIIAFISTGHELSIFIFTLGEERVEMELRNCPIVANDSGTQPYFRIQRICSFNLSTQKVEALVTKPGRLMRVKAKACNKSGNAEIVWNDNWFCEEKKRRQKIKPNRGGIKKRKIFTKPRN